MKRIKSFVLTTATLGLLATAFTLFSVQDVRASTGSGTTTVPAGCMEYKLMCGDFSNPGYRVCYESRVWGLSCPSCGPCITEPPVR